MDGWLREIPLILGYYERFGDRIPAGLLQEAKEMSARLENAKRSAA